MTVAEAYPRMPSRLAMVALSVLGDEGLFYWRDAFTPLTVRCWRVERRGVMATSWSGWRLIRVFGWRVALLQKGPW